MTVAAAPGVSLAERVRPVETGAAVFAVHFLGRTAAFALVEEAVVLALPDAALPQRVAAHEGGILAAASNGTHLVTGGDDGRVVLTSASGETRIRVTDSRRRWIDQVALLPNGTIAWSAGKSVFVRSEKEEERTLELPSSAGGLAFARKGFRLAIARYAGVTLWFPNASAAPENLEWKGSHLGVVFSPDGKFLVTTMQEPMLHGWRLADGKHMRMSGYAAKVRALAWSADGEWLATSGADQLILWPFAGKDGPMGKAPKALAPRDQRVSAVACHPGQPVSAVGYADGLVLLVRITDGAEILVRPRGGGAVSALAFSPLGDALAFGTEDAAAGVLML